MGLILAQSLSVGVAVGIFDSGLWLVLDDTVMNGATYAMAAFAMQGVGYYVFKMFFQQGMDDRMHIQEGEKKRQSRYRDMQRVFDTRREDLELRMQEIQLESELKWMEQNPGRPPTWAAIENEDKLFNPKTPQHEALKQSTINLGVSFDESESESEDEAKTRNNNGTFKKKE
jgi:hypothetical protein